MKQSLPGKHILSTEQDHSTLKLKFYLILLGYVVIPVMLPNFNTLDSNGPKFLALGLLNLFSFIVFLADSGFNRRPELRFGFFRSMVGMSYLLFLLFSALSFFNAINLNESVTYFVRVLTVFGSTYVLFVIFSRDRRYLRIAAVALTGILVFDSISLLFEVTKYIGGSISSISDITSVYSNKNVLGSALFVKIPAAIWLIFFTKGWSKRLVYLAVFIAMFGIFLLSTRAFYLGLPGLILALVLYNIIRYTKTRRSSGGWILLHIAGLFLASLVLYSITQRYVLPKGFDSGLNKGVISRLSTVADIQSGSDRLDSWKRSVTLIADRPILGVGTGNWKIAVLKYENPELKDFTYIYKNHNDFIEVTAETGLPGGIAYLAIILFILFGFIRFALRKEDEQDRLKWMFLPAFGILAYSVDAFFNFPASRPEMQALFAIYVAAGAAYSKAPGIHLAKGENDTSGMILLKKFQLNKIVAVLSVLLLAIGCWILFLNTKSLHYQRLVKKDLVENRYSIQASELISGYPAIPNINCVGGPIAIDKARYLMNENRIREAIDVLGVDSSSPYDARREYYLAMNYIKLGKKDSALIMLDRLRRLKPLFANGAILLSSLLFEVGQREEGMQVANRFLEKEKTNREVWMLSADQHLNTGDTKGALAVLDSALTYLVADSILTARRSEIARLTMIEAHRELYDQARALFNAKEYPNALKLLDELLVKAPELFELYSVRAWCNFFTEHYAACISDITIAFGRGNGNPDLLNLRGEAYYKLGQVESACRDFKAAMDKGNAAAGENYRKYCGK